MVLVNLSLLHFSIFNDYICNHTSNKRRIFSPGLREGTTFVKDGR